MIRRLALIVLILYSTGAASKGSVVALRGEATIKVMPDIIRLKVGISQLEKSDVAAAKSKVDLISSKAATELVAMGIKDADITSSSLRVETATKYDNNDNPVPSGFAASREIEIVVRDIKMYSAVIQKLVDTGVTDIGDAQPDISDKEELERKALAKAAESAKSKAEFLAGQFGAKLGKVYNIGEQQVSSRFQYLEEVVVTARKRDEDDVIDNKSVQYDFKPAPVNVKSSIYVEFELE